MIFIKIGPEERRLEDTTPQWITQMIVWHREHYGTVCVSVRFDMPGINLMLATATCGRGRGRAIETFTREERALIDLWRKFDLFDDSDFAPGRIVAFIGRMSRRLGVAA